MRDKAIAVCAAALLVLVTACNGLYTKSMPPYPPKYIQPVTRADVDNTPPTKNSLWRASGKGLFSDVKAHDVNDLVTIKIVENAAATKDAETKTTRDSSYDAGISTFFGVPLDFGLTNLFGKGKGFSPNVAANVGDSYDGKGKTKRSGALNATITAKVVEVLPNGNLVIESRKEMTVNNEEQILILRGLIRPEDIASDNTIASDYVAEAQIFYTGEGVLQDKQSPGWMVRLMDKVWPF